VAFLAADVPERPPFSALSAALLFAITDAVKTGSSLALQFTKRFTAGVPLAVRKLAAAHGIALEHADRGAIAPAESRALYVALTAFTAAARARLRSLTEREQLSPERVCYLVHHGVWALDEVDALLVAAPYPALVLGAVPPAEQRILSQVALVTMLRDEPHGWLRPRADWLRVLPKLKPTGSGFECGARWPH